MLDELKSDVRRFSLQHIRKALVAASGPVRSLELPVASGIGRPSASCRPVFGVRETGVFRSQPIDFAPSMEDRPYDQSSVVLTIDNGGGTFRNLHALDPDRRVLYEGHLTLGEMPIALQRLEAIEESYPSVVYLSNTLPHNFYHWFLFILPLLRFYRAADIDIEHVYVGAELTSWQRRSLDFVGLTEDMIVTQPCRADVAHVAVPSRPLGGVPPETIEWSRSAFVQDEPSGGDRRLFLSRGQATTRRMLDEERIAAALEQAFGFEYVDTSTLTLDQEIELFGQAEHIVAPYGAALTNTLFSPRGISILELTAFDHDFSVAHCYQEISAVLGHRHGVVRGDRTARKKKGVNSDIKVPLERILPAVEAMLGAPARRT